MHLKKIIVGSVVVGIVSVAIFYVLSGHYSPEARLKEIKLPPGFHIALYAKNIPDARSLALGARGTVFVGTRSEGKVYALVDMHKRNRADTVITLARDLRIPNGVAFYKGSLYVAELSRILRYDTIEERLRRPPKPTVISEHFPKDVPHGWKFIAFGPDGYLYVPVGAPCNVCKQKDKRYASILRLRPGDRGLEVYAHGVRNTVGFDWHPATGELWFTDNGRDWLGDDSPPDELNYAPHKGLHFGFPYCHAGTVPDPKFGKEKPCSQFTPPALRLDPHVAALGMRFYTGTMFPREYRNRIFIAEHGSWNRGIPVGYRITCVTLNGTTPAGYKAFAEGWLQKNGKAWGRPVDVLVMPDGALLVSDDRAGAVYRISYSKK